MPNSLLEQNIPTHNDIIYGKGLDHDSLVALRTAIEVYLKTKGFKIWQDDSLLERYKNDPNLYKNYVCFDSYHDMNQIPDLPCICNGIEIVYGDYNKHCSMALVIYSILHVACGHLWQWSSNKTESGLRYKCNKAWKIGKKVYQEHLGKRAINRIISYEREAIAASLQNLDLIFGNTELDDVFRNKFKLFYIEYSKIDLNCLIYYSRKTKYKNILLEKKEYEIRTIEIQYDIDVTCELEIKQRGDFQ